MLLRERFFTSNVRDCREEDKEITIIAYLDYNNIVINEETINYFREKLDKGVAPWNIECEMKKIKRFIDDNNEDYDFMPQNHNILTWRHVN